MSNRIWKNWARFVIPCLGISMGNVQSLNDKLLAMWLISTLRGTVMKSLTGRRRKQICNIFCNITCVSQECLAQKCHHPALGLLLHNCPLWGILPFTLTCSFVFIVINKALEPDGSISGPDAGKTRAQRLAHYYFPLYIVYN